LQKAKEGSLFYDGNVHESSRAPGEALVVGPFSTRFQASCLGIKWIYYFNGLEVAIIVDAEGQPYFTQEKE